jgi:mannose-1-phosphate guanylyltransferase
MDVVILAGGFATRLRPLSYSRPKALLPILDKSMIDWIMESISAVVNGRIFVSIRYMGDRIREHVGKQWAPLRDRIFFITEERPLGDAGPIVLIDEEYRLSKTFMVIYGDVFSDLDMGRVLKFHRESGGIATLVLARASDVSRYGVAQLSGDRIVGFIEKPRHSVQSNLVNAGIYVFQREVLDYIPRRGGEPLKLAVDVIPRLLGTNDVYGYVHDGLWFDIGTTEDYMSANFKVLEVRCRDPCIETEPGDARIEPPIYVGKGVALGHGSELGPRAIIHSNSRVGEAARITESIIFENSTISKGTYVKGSIVGGDSYVGRWVRIEEGSILGDGVYVKDYVFIGRRSKVGPYREVAESIYGEDKVLL